MAENNETVSLTQLAIDKKPAEFKAVVGDKLTDLLRTAIDDKKSEVANGMLNTQED